ncbi:MAG TPA: nitronate monooxygenase [Candidatus Enterenecus merdae]|nr:nitronate monooxygenase [Candidatus Enterenecus merdae]
MKLNEILGTEFPIIQGGMANIATGAFAAAVSNAGAMGVVASGGMDAEALRREIRAARAATDKPFGVNLMLMNPHIEELAQMVAEEGVSLVTTGAGNPGKYIPAWKEAGIKVFPVVPAPVLAKRLERYGVDGFIAEGTESGGHVGEMTTMALIPQVVDAVDVPVVAAGGIADGRQMAAAFALGACGVQVGTCLLASVECPIHDNYKQAVIKAKATDTVVTGRSTGAPVRVLKNKMAQAYLQMEKNSPPREELEKLTLGSLRRAVVDGDVDNGSFMAGQVAGMVREIRPLREIFQSLMEGCQAVGRELWL